MEIATLDNQASEATVGLKTEDNNENSHQSDQVDLYADVDPSDQTNVEHTSGGGADETHDDGVVVTTIDESGLYDDVMAAPTPTNITNDFGGIEMLQHENMNTNTNANNIFDEFNDESSEHKDEQNALAQNNNTTSSNENTNSSENRTTGGGGGGGGNNSYSSSQYYNSGRYQDQYARRVSCYVGNLTWWTSDKDLSDVLTTKLGIADLIDIKFYENKINGQSKGFASVIIGSDQSYRTIIEKIPKIEINGQEPVATPFNRFHCNQFEDQARKDMPSSGGSGYGDNYNDNYSNNNYNNNHNYNNNNYNNNTYNNNGFRDGGNRIGGGPGSGMSNNSNNMSNYSNQPYNRDMSMLHFLKFYLL